MKIICGGCRGSVETGGAAPGTLVACPGCGGHLPVPGLRAAAPAAPPPLAPRRTPPAPPSQGATSGTRAPTRGVDALTRACPSCGARSPMRATRCAGCGTVFARVARANARAAEGSDDAFRLEKAAMDKGMLGGIGMIVLAAVWFFLGLRGGRIFFYPPVLAVFGIVAIVRSVGGGASRSRSRRR